MNPKKNAKVRSFPMPAAHGRLVDRLAHGLEAVPPAPPLGLRWAVWAGLNGLVLGVFLFLFHPRPDLGGAPLWGGILLLFTGAGLAAYGALEAGIPGEERKGRWKFKAAVLAWAAALVWTLVSIPWQWKAYTPVLACDSCFALVLETGLLGGLVLFLFLRRMAPLSPFRSALWAGASAFLMGLAAISLHCPSGNLLHILMEHFLPVLLYSVLAAFLASGWLSGWKKRPIGK